MLTRIWAHLRTARGALLVAGGAVMLGGLIAAALLSSCRREDLADQRTAPGAADRPLRLEGVPSVRVRVTDSPARQVMIGAAGACDVFMDDRKIAGAEAALDPTPVTRTGTTWRIGSVTAQGACVSVRPRGDGQVRLDGTNYRGRLLLVARGEDRMLGINEVDMESYLAGVLPRELYPDWHAEAYRAQAVAARTFALYHVITGSPGAEYDLGAGQAAQVYGGADAETARSWDAVRRTHGLVLTVGGGGRDKVFMAQYSSCCGGRVNAARAIRPAADLAPLRGGQRDGHCAACPRYQWDDVVVPTDAFYRALLAYRPQAARRLGGVSDVRVAERGAGRWVAWVTVVGTAGGSGEDVAERPTMQLRGQNLRLVLRRHVPVAAKLHSIQCDIRFDGNNVVFTEGRGFGHGVGLCQWGAQGKAMAGWSAERILGFYYPGARLIRAYAP
ncbi:MAG: SpoIID/LytB domain-containing protein [Phycisphaerae bacterium]|nr:SpoIID/LytB domain-containing protein [Phycisphaerae bacterium]